MEQVYMCPTPAPGPALATLKGLPQEKNTEKTKRKLHEPFAAKTRRTAKSKDARPSARTSKSKTKSKTKSKKKPEKQRKTKT
jgi:hypothetical protein